MVQTTVKAMKRIAEIKNKREHAFWKHRYVCCLLYLCVISWFVPRRMAAAKEKLRAHRKKKLEKTTAVKLVQPITADASPEKVRQKIKVATKSRSALIQGEGRSMAMEID